MDYSRCKEEYTKEEQETLNLFFSNLDQPVFALKNLPEVVKGAMFARYSRYQGGLRRLFLDEFSQDLPTEVVDLAEGDKAAGLYERVFVGYGDDSIAQVGGAHIACEYVSNILTKVIQRGRLAAYLEQSTRYIPYDKELPGGGYRYYSDETLGAIYQNNMNEIFRIYSDSIQPTIEALKEEFPKDPEVSEKAWKNSLKAKAFDLLRGLLPAGTLSHVGMFASGQAYEQMIMRMLASPLPEANDYGYRILKELQTTIPSFLSRIEIPERGGEWISYFENRREETKAALNILNPSKSSAEGSSVKLVETRGSEDELMESSLFESSDLSSEEIKSLLHSASAEDKDKIFQAALGDRKNRRHRPGRGWEAVSYRFEIVSDYGAFRDLQRHRMLTCQWQELSPELGAEAPEQLPESVRSEYRRGLALSAKTYEAIKASSSSAIAQYSLCLGYKIRYVLDLNAREAMQLTELRSGVEGHPSYRAVAQEMHRLIREKHPRIGDGMSYIDHSSEPRLERILSEIRTEKKKEAFDNKTL